MYIQSAIEEKPHTRLTWPAPGPFRAKVQGEGGFRNISIDIDTPYYIYNISESIVQPSIYSRNTFRIAPTHLL